MHWTVSPTRIICAMPRASLRSVLLICAFNTARMCRVSTQITGKPASARALNSHCDPSHTTTGLLVWAFASAAGLQLAAEWGVIAFVLNYIPVIGPLAATVFPTLFAIAQFETWQMAAFVFGCLNLIQFVVGSYLEPRIAGGALSLSPFLVLFAVFFWAFLWGIRRSLHRRTDRHRGYDDLRAAPVQPLGGGSVQRPRNETDVIPSSPRCTIG
jgi:AI-2E family transporter